MYSGSNDVSFVLDRMKMSRFDFNRLVKFGKAVQDVKDTLERTTIICS